MAPLRRIPRAVSLPENPISALLTMRETRDTLGGWTLGVFLVAVASLALAVIYFLKGLYGVFLFAGIFAGLLLVLIPLFQAVGYGSLLTSLRRGRCFEEVMSTGVTAVDIADGIAVHGVGRALQAGLPVWGLFLVMSCLFDGGWFLLIPAGLLWMPLLIFLASFDAYALLALSALGGGMGRGVPFQVVAGSVILAPLSLLGAWVAGLYFLFDPSWYDAVPTFLCVGLTLAAAVGAARSAAVVGLHRGEAWQSRFGSWSRAVKARRRSTSSGPANPLAFREWARQKGRLNLGVLLLGLPLVLLWWGGRAPVAGSVSWAVVLGATGALLVLQTLRGALSTTGAVVDERESGTLAFVALTRLSPRDFLDGSAQAAWLPLALETTFALPLLLVSGLQAGASPLLCMLAAGLLYSAPWAAVYLGLSASASSFQRGAARMHTLTWLAVLGLAAVALMLPSLLLLAYAGVEESLQNVLALTALLGLPACWVAALAFRLVALRDLSNEGLDSLGLPGWLVRLYSEAM